jgi:hypothetical protein
MRLIDGFMNNRGSAVACPLNHCSLFKQIFIYCENDLYIMDVLPVVIFTMLLLIIINSLSDIQFDRILPYFNFVTEHMNIVALLFDVHKGQKVPLQLRKIEYIVHKKIQEFRHLKLDGSHSQRLET